MIGYIYKITNIITNKSYIGQTNNPHRRWIEHRCAGNTGNYKNRSYLYSAMDKYGVDKFEFCVLEECSIDLMECREKWWIKKMNTLAPNGYNILKGGKSLFGKNNPFYGKKHSEKTKSKISKANSGRVATDEERQMRRLMNAGEGNPFYGRKHSKETIELLKSKFTNERREELSNRIKGSKNPNYNGKYFKKAICMIDKNTGKVLKEFESTKEAGIYLKEKGLTKSNSSDRSVASVARGEQITAYGYKWKYVKEDVTTNETT